MQTGTVSLANIRLSLVDGAAFIDSSAENALTPYLNNKIVLTDSSGKKAVGYIKSAGTGETLDTEILANSSFTGTWASNVPQSWTLDGTQNGTNYLAADDAGDRLRIVSGDGSTMGITQNAAVTTTHVGKCLKLVSVWDAVTGKVRVVFLTPAQAPSASAIITTAGTYTGYLTGSAAFTDASLRISRQVAGQTCDATISDVSLKQVLSPSPTGVLITSTAGGTTYNWASIEAGFNYNDASGYTYKITPRISQSRFHRPFRR